MASRERGMTFLSAVLLLTSANVKGDDNACSWCERGDATCDWNFDEFSLAHFTTSISGQVQRAMPYFKPSAQTPLGVADSDVTNAVIVHHGAGRNAEDYLSYMVNAIVNNQGQGAENALQLENTIVIAPQVWFPGDDGLDENVHIWWDVSGDDGFDTDDLPGERDWKWGGNSSAELPASISTFSVLDEMLDTLSNKTLYPNLESVVMAGHSAGGQIMQRFALFSTRAKGGSRDLGLDLKFYVANPSSTTYLGPERPVQAPERDCAFCINSTIESQEWAFEKPTVDLECVDTYNAYGYGLEGNLPDYPAATGVAQALAQYPLRRVTYMSGESDVCDTPYMETNQCLTCIPDDGGLDPSCEGYAQGWCRMARLHAFSQYVQAFYDQGEAAQTHKLMSVPDVGHSGCGMFQSPEFAAGALTRLPQAQLGS